MKIAIGKFARKGISTCLGSDVAAAVRAALVDFTESLDSDSPPTELPGWLLGGEATEMDDVVELSVDERTFDLLEREASRQGVTVNGLATHSVLVYLAEFDRLTSSSEGAAAL